MKTIKQLLITVAVLLCSATASAHDFEVDGIYYNILTEEDKAVEVTYRGDYADAHSNEYSNIVTLSENVTYNGISYSVTKIRSSAFENCTSLTSITIPNSVTTIGSYAFYNCSSLANVTIGNSVTNIGSYAFRECISLTSITIPNSVTTIKKGAFNRCTNLTSVTIPNSVTTIEKEAFYRCNNLASITIPNSVTNVGIYAFYDCTRLTSVTIGNSVTNIGNNTFYNCSSLTNVIIGNSVTSIGDCAFENCTSLTSITIPRSVTAIGMTAYRYCSSLKSIYLLGETPPSVGYDNFRENQHANTTLYVPYGAKEAYAAATGWKAFKNIVEMEKEDFDLTVTSAGYASLYLDYAVEIPSGVEVYIGKVVEGNYLKLQLVEGTLPANTGAIVKGTAGTYKFNKTEDNVPTIEDNLFYGTVAYTYIKPADGTVAYVLSIVDGEVGMYRAELDENGTFLNNANKAYMLLAQQPINDGNIDTNISGAQPGSSYRFDFGGTTGVENITFIINDNIYYDLSGRCVETPPHGIYIVNGKKMFVK